MISHHSAVQVREELTTRVEVLNRGRSNTEAWVKALKHDLAMERTKSDVAEQRMESQTARAKVPHKIYGRVELRARECCFGGDEKRILLLEVYAVIREPNVR